MNRPFTLTLAAAVAGGALLAGCGGGSGSPVGNGTIGASSASHAPAGSVVVGSANFPENVLLAQIYADALTAKGVTASTKLNIGSRETYIPALKDGSIAMIPEYTGSLLSYLKGTSGSSPSAVYTALKKVLPSNLTVLAPAAAEDKDTVAVTKETAKKYHLTSIADLKPVESQITIGGPPEFKSRQTGLLGLKAKYGLTFKAFKPLDTAGPLTVSALDKGSVQAADLFSTDSSFATKGFVALADPKNVFQAENVVPLIAKSSVTAKVTSVLNAVSAKLTTPKLASMVKQVQVDHANSDTVAKQFLSDNGLS